MIKILVLKLYVYMFNKILFYDTNHSYLIRNEWNLYSFTGYDYYFCKKELEP